MQTDIGKILSVIVSSYDMEAYLPKCLGSLVVEELLIIWGDVT